MPIFLLRHQLELNELWESGLLSRAVVAACWPSDQQQTWCLSRASAQRAFLPSDGVVGAWPPCVLQGATVTNFACLDVLLDMGTRRFTSLALIYLTGNPCGNRWVLVGCGTSCPWVKGA